MSTEKSNGGPFVTFREECEILRARVVELEAQLSSRTDDETEQWNSWVQYRDAEVAGLQEQLAEKDNLILRQQQKINAFYGGNKDGGIVSKLEAQLATVNDELKLARKGAEFCFKQAKDADANATVQVEARKFFEAQLAERDAERESHLELVRDLDRIWNGPGAAKQASLCDMVSQISVEKPMLDKLLLLAKNALEEVYPLYNGHAFKSAATEAIAAINDSKAVEDRVKFASYLAKEALHKRPLV